jgi:hypothetical protein
MYTYLKATKSVLCYMRSRSIRSFFHHKLNTTLCLDGLVDSENKQFLPFPIPTHPRIYTCRPCTLPYPQRYTALTCTLFTYTHLPCTPSPIPLSHFTVPTPQLAHPTHPLFTNICLFLLALLRSVRSLRILFCVHAKRF